VIPPIPSMRGLRADADLRSDAVKREDDGGKGWDEAVEGGDIGRSGISGAGFFFPNFGVLVTVQRQVGHVLCESSQGSMQWR